MIAILILIPYNRTKKGCQNCKNCRNLQTDQAVTIQRSKVYYRKIVCASQTNPVGEMISPQHKRRNRLNKNRRYIADERFNVSQVLVEFSINVEHTSVMEALPLNSWALLKRRNMLPHWRRGSQ